MLTRLLVIIVLSINFISVQSFANFYGHNETAIVNDQPLIDDPFDGEN